jgi:hypothetical protein
VEQALDFLQKGADVRTFLDEGQLAPGGDLAEKAREARAADVVLVFFSRQSLPSRWPRSQWEDALVKEPEEEGVRIAFLRCDDCNPPKVLENQFDLTGRRLDGLRALKRWIRGGQAAYVAPSPDAEVVAIAVADRPGMEVVDRLAIAEEAMRVCAEDFDAVMRLHCPGRSLTAVMGDLGWQLGLDLDGDAESNLERLETFCSARRLLVVLEAPDDAVAEALVFGGRCSTILSMEAGAPPDDPLQQAQRALNDATLDWLELCRLARQGRQITTNRGRLAECYELMQRWHALAEEKGDREAANEAAKELFWLLQKWGQSEEAMELEGERAKRYDEQMRLF